MQSVKEFLKVKNVCYVEIHRQIVEMYGEGTKNEGNVRKWCWLFTKARLVCMMRNKMGK